MKMLISSVLIFGTAALSMTGHLPTAHTPSGSLTGAEREYHDADSEQKLSTQLMYRIDADTSV